MNTDLKINDPEELKSFFNIRNQLPGNTDWNYPVRINNRCPLCGRPGTKAAFSPTIAHQYENILYCDNCKELFSTNDD